MLLFKCRQLQLRDGCKKKQKQFTSFLCVNSFIYESPSCQLIVTTVPTISSQGYRDIIIFTVEGQTVNQTVFFIIFIYLFIYAYCPTPPELSLGQGIVS